MKRILYLKGLQAVRKIGKRVSAAIFPESVTLLFQMEASTLKRIMMAMGTRKRTSP
jgi:hypothetical protein